MTVAVVTDSTADLPPGLARDSGVIVVPLQVTAGGVSGRDGTDVRPADVLRELAERRADVLTALPSPGDFAAAYARAARDGADAVVSVHLSGAMSGTCNAARQAGPAASLPVLVVDSRSTGMGLGFPVLEAVRRARAGGGAEAVAAAAEACVDRTRTFLYVDTLEFLRRGGRIGAARALLGTALSVKPLLQVKDGLIAPLERTRTASRAIARMIDIVVAEAGESSVDLAVHHLGTPARARGVADQLAARIPRLGDLHLSEVGAVVGAHVGPGPLGVVVHHRPD